MNKIINFSVYLTLIFLFTMTLPACQMHDKMSNSDKKVMINDVNYSSLTEAVASAKEDDTINIYNDVKDNKNITITKPLTIKGVSSNNQTKPKFYGSLTVDLNGENDSLDVENIELIHSGKKEVGENNDNSVGINLVDGGLTLKSSIIALSSPEDADNNATGIIISRSIESINTSPISIIGNNFESYLTNNENLSSAIKILSNKSGLFKSLSLNEDEILKENNFFSHDLSNQLISMDLSTEPTIYNYYATTSLNDFIKALKENQGTTNSTFVLYANKDQTLSEDIKEITANGKTSIYIYGDSNLDFNNLNLKLGGTMESEVKLNNLNLEKITETANFIDKSEQ